jgi:uncharacterized protein YqgV (UPF0045/DUF77 family)
MIAAHIQFIPLASDAPIELVDHAIAIIQKSGLQYEVGPFGTSVEGEATLVSGTVEALLACPTTSEFLLNVQYHVGPTRLSNLEKVAKFR